MIRATRLAVFSILALVVGASAAERQKGSDLIVAIVDSGGGTTVRWWLPRGEFPVRGFRIERSIGGAPRTTITTVAPDVAAAAGRDPRLGRVLTRYLELARDASRAADPKQRERFELARFEIELLTLGDPAAAASLGLSARDPSPPAGATVVYTVIALGATETVYAASEPVRIAPMPPPAPPAELRAEPGRDGVRLFWRPAPQDKGKNWEAASFEILRRDAPGAAPRKASAYPVLPSAESGSAPAFQDLKAPVEKSLVYSVVPIDLTGRRGPESRQAEVFQPDFAALDPPSELTARLEAGKVLLTWKGPANTNRAGWRVERAANPDALGERLTPKAVAGGSFTDTTARRGTSWYYRVSAVNRRGEAGEPSLRVAVRVTDTKPPAPPGRLTSARRAGQIVLTWEAPADVTGFQVERSMDGRSWELLTAIASAEPRFEDLLPRETGGKVLYRVRSLTADDVASEPSAPLSVTLPDAVPPAPPVIEKIEGTEGRVALQFRAGGGPGDAERFYVLRSASAIDSGAIVDPKGLPAAATSFTDTGVEAGRTLHYRVVAVDAAGNRSDPSEAAGVRVGVPALPTPPAPKLRFETKPWPRLVIEFPAPPAPSVRWVVERREPGGRWLVVQGPLPADATRALDVNPLRGRRAAYRLSAVGTNGEAGLASAPAEIDIPGK